MGLSNQKIVVSGCRAFLWNFCPSSSATVKKHGGTPEAAKNTVAAARFMTELLRNPDIERFAALAEAASHA